MPSLYTGQPQAGDHKGYLLHSASVTLGYSISIHIPAQWDQDLIGPDY